MQVIGFCGYAGSGKDEAAKALVELGWERIAFADPIREIALAIDPIVSMKGFRLATLVRRHGWTKAKELGEVRRLLQRIGTEAGRNILGEFFWSEIGHNRAIDCGKNVVFTDVRFHNEVEMIRELGGKIIRIVRPGVGPANGHESELAIDEIETDAVIQNEGSSEELWEKVRSLVIHIERVEA